MNGTTTQGIRPPNLRYGERKLWEEGDDQHRELLARLSRTRASRERLKGTIQRRVRARSHGADDSTVERVREFIEALRGWYDGNHKHWVETANAIEAVLTRSEALEDVMRDLVVRIDEADERREGDLELIAIGAYAKAALAAGTS